MRRVVVLGALLALAAPGQAFAHASLRSTFPTFRERIESSPGTVRLRFDQIVKALPDSIVVLSAQGDRLSGTTTSSRFTVSVPVRRLPRGAYTVRWLYFLALALVAGGLGFRLLVLRGPLRQETEKRFYQVVGLGAVGAVEVGILAFLLRADDALQLPFGKFLYGDLSPISGGTRYGRTFVAMTLGFALVAALVYLAWLLDRTRLLVPALALALFFAGGLSASGHDAVDPGSTWKSALADWVHLAAVSLWIGGLVALALTWRVGGREAIGRFSRFATWLVALVVAAGTYLAIVRLPAAHDLWRTGYGHVLLVKLALVVLVLAWGGVHKLFPRARVLRSVTGEMAVGLAVLLAAAVLTDSKPPQPGPSSASSRSAYAGAVGSSSWRK